jgi:hypothetical protein
MPRGPLQGLDVCGVALKISARSPDILAQIATIIMPLSFVGLRAKAGSDGRAEDVRTNDQHSEQ